MPRRPKVKARKVISKEMTKQDMNEMQEMFKSLTGENDADIEVLLPKYVELRNSVGSVVKVWNILKEFPDLLEIFPECADACAEFAQFVKRVEENHKITSSTVDTPATHAGVSQSEINVLYNGLKDSDEVKAITIACGQLNQFKRHLQEDSLSDKFIRTEPGLDLIPVSFFPINLKAIWMSEHAGSMLKNIILKVLQKTYVIGLRVYNNITSPNVDIKKFSGVLVKAIKLVRKQCPRCDDAFRIISDSVDMLENNFTDYFKQSVEANNMGMIMESFIVDVSTKQRNSPRVTQQFGRIISFMQRKTAESGQSKNPQVQALFRMLNSRFGMMKESVGEVDDDEGEDAGIEDADDDEDEDAGIEDADDDEDADTKEADEDEDAGIEEANEDEDADTKEADEDEDAGIEDADEGEDAGDDEGEDAGDP
jgi:hypothetical protein